jgi:hypothetical protein
MVGAACCGTDDCYSPSVFALVFVFAPKTKLQLETRTEDLKSDDN